jgi:PAS domain S-box-containing protein
MQPTPARLRLSPASAMGGWIGVWRFWPVWLCAALTLGMSLSLMQQHHHNSQAQQHQRVDEQLALLRAQLEAQAQTAFSPTLGLEAMVQLDGGISAQRFEQLIARAITLVPQIRSVAAAPNDVIRHLYPLAGNEKALNLDYRNVPAQWAQVQQTRQRGRPQIQAPVRLVQGGMGVIQRTPVFLRPSEGETQPRYWGMVSVVMDLDRFIQAAGLPQSGELLLAIHNLQADGRLGERIWGEPGLASDESVRQVAQLPGAQWLLLARPAAGWGGTPWGPEVMATALGGSLVTLLLALLMRQQQQLRRHNDALSERIAEGERMRIELQASQSRFRSLAELASDWVWEQDESLRFVYTSRAAEEASDTDSAHVIGYRRWESPALVPGTDWSAHRAQLERREPFRDFEYAQYGADGSVRHISVCGEPFFDTHGRFLGYRGTGRNISAQRRAEDNLRASQVELQAAKDRLQAVLDGAVEVAIIATDRERHITLFNRGAERMLGYAEPEVLGQTPSTWHLAEEIQACAQQLSAQLDQPVQDDEVFSVLTMLHGSDTRVWTFVRRDGSQLQASLSVSTLYSRLGETIGYLGVARDVSAQLHAEAGLRELNTHLEARVQARTVELKEALQTLQRAQDELLRSEKMAALGSLVAGVAHELNTPLGNCLTTASTLHERTREIATQMEGSPMRRSVLEAYLRDARTASDILLRGLSTANELVTHFKQLSVDQTSEQRRRFALAGTVDDVLSLARARWKSTPYRIEADIRLERELDGYPGPLGQVLSNLLHNALLHAFEGRDHGLLRISASPLDEGHFTLEVADDGLGMSEEVRRRAFDPFFTTKLGRGGTGLGLNIVYNIVTTVMGGELALHSHPGEGSRFVFTLPYVAPHLA